METYADMLSAILPLSPAEKICKKFLQEHPENQVMNDKELQAFFQNVIDADAEAMDSNLTEDSLIPDSYNVMALKHLRYLPGCLHSHDFFEINCVLSGSCTYQALDKSVSIQAGDIVAFPPHAVHSIEVCADDCILINILIRASTFDRYFFSLFHSHDVLTDFWTQALYGKRETSYLLFHCGEELKIRTYALNIFQEAAMNRRYKGQMLDALLHVFLIALLQDHEQDLIIANPDSQKDDRNIIRIINYIGEQYKALTLSRLAEEFHYSERQMMRVLKEYTGLSFSDFIRDIKLKRAVTLLENSEVSIQSIVEAVGYSDLSHLYRVFKKEYGCTPSEYRARKQS